MAKISEEWLEFLRQQFPRGSRVRLDVQLESQKDRETGCHGILKEITDDGNLRIQRNNGEMLDVVLGKERISILPPLTHTLKLYMPLTADLYERDRYGDLENDPVELDGRDLQEYEDQIMAALLRNRIPEEAEWGLMTWYHESDEVDRKVRSAVFTVEARNGQLWGVAECQVTEDLEPEELDTLKEYLTGQASDAWGEGFEQREISVQDGGELYVHLWNYGNDWSIQTEDERFRPKLAQGLPEMCFSTLKTTGELICIKRGEMGYYPSSWSTPDREENKRLAEYNNETLGVTRAQRIAMEVGSIAGWNVPGADPATYEQEQQMGGMDLG